VIVGCIDGDKLQAQAFTRERKLADCGALAGQLLTEKYGTMPRTIIFIRSFFPCATGDARITSAARWKRSKASG